MSIRRNSLCKNDTDYVTLEDLDEVEVKDTVYIKLKDNIFCMENESFKQMIKMAEHQTVLGNCRRIASQYLDADGCDKYYPFLAAPQVFLREKSYIKRYNDVMTNGHTKFYKLINKQRIDFTTGNHYIGEKTGFDDVYDLVPATFTVDANGTKEIQVSGFTITGTPLRSTPSVRRSTPSVRRSRAMSPPPSTPGFDRRSPPVMSSSPLRRYTRSPPPVRPRGSPPRNRPQQNYTVVELKRICKEKGIRGYSKMKKAQMITHCRINDAISSTNTVQQLRQLCKEKGIRGYSKMNKSELIRKCTN